jgi:hypothetical protein
MNRFTTAALAAVAIAGMAWPNRAEASFANSLKKQYRAKMSSNPSIAAQQVTADPDMMMGGTTSIGYDPSLVTLVFQNDPFSPNTFDVVESPGFDVQLAQVLVSGPDGAPARFINQNDFMDPPPGLVEEGVVRVSYTRLDVPSPVVLPPQAGFGDYLYGDDYEQGDDLFAVVFYERPINQLTAFSDFAAAVSAKAATYTIYTGPGDTVTMLPEGSNQPQMMTAGEMQPGTVTAPEPGMIGLFAVAGLAALGRRRSRKNCRN